MQQKSDYELEFERIHQNFSTYHGAMNVALQGYENSFYYQPKPNEPMNYVKGVNWVEVFTNKLIDYLSPFPKIAIPATPLDREGASNREKLLYSLHEQSRAQEQWQRAVFYGSVMSASPIKLNWNPITQTATWQAVDPRNACWQTGDQMGNTIDTFWTYIPMTASQIRKQYKVDPVAIGATEYSTYQANMGTTVPNYELDAVPTYLVIERTTDQTVTILIGGVVVNQYNHLLPEIPFELILPIVTPAQMKRGQFYINRIKWLTADYNQLWRERASIIRRLGRPVVWTKGVNQKTIDSIQTDGLENGFIGMRNDGEVGLLNIPETRMIDEALNDVFARLRDASGFPTATFGEIAGANTSGDALNSYMQPAVRMIDGFNQAYLAGLTRINAKMLRYTETLGVPGQPINLDGVLPSPYGMNQMSAFNDVMFPEDIHGRYSNVCTANSVTPKDEIAYKRFALDSTNLGIMSKTTFYNEIGLLNPEDELRLLTEEQANPILNPQGTLAVMQGAQAHQQLNNPAVAPNAPQGN